MHLNFHKISQTKTLTHYSRLHNKASSLSDSISILERLSPSSPVHLWNPLIQNEVKNGQYNNALTVFRQMIRAGTKPDHFTLPFALKACAQLPSYLRGSLVHGLVRKTGFESNVFVCNALVAMYGRTGSLEEARKVFDEMLHKGIDDVISWNSIVWTYSKNGFSRQALDLFAKMQGVVCFKDSANRSDVISLVNVLPACASLKALKQALEIHGYAIRTGLFLNIFIGNALIDVYAKCGIMQNASNVFNSMEVKDEVSWNSIVTGLAQTGNFEEAFRFFERMRENNIPLNVIAWTAIISSYAQRGQGFNALNAFRQMLVSKSVPNEVTIISLLSAIASIGSLSHGEETHAYVIKNLMDLQDPMVKNALIDMYAKCGSFNSAQHLFNSVPIKDRNVVTWTAMIGGHAQFGDPNFALKLFSKMFLKPYAINPNSFTISCALMATARLSSFHFGRQIHAYLFRHDYLHMKLHVSNCLIDMYGKCGDIFSSRKVFDGMHERNNVSWTSIMAGYGMQGQGSETLKLFHRMQNGGFKPDEITFLVLLYACSHAGLVDTGLEYFDKMSQNYGIAPSAIHYACVVDLLGRAGRLEKAWEMINNMPIKPTHVVWVAFLSACRVHKNVELGELALEKWARNGLNFDSSYTLLSNIYANASRWKDVARIRLEMKEMRIKKQPGCMGDKSHPRSKEIYDLLGRLMERIKSIGYTPQIDFALHDVDEEEKSNILGDHSEKLALAYGLLVAPKGEVIRVYEEFEGLWGLS
ncbi:hypothetical protein LUZ60_013410 [Juncus effusus]|nr:hypothetical protein LUZ60_013410 [Juncus effusus]